MKTFYKKDKFDVPAKDKVAHAWAHQLEEEGQVYGGSFYFYGDTIFSYGSHFPIARIYHDKNVILFTSHSYSSTTAGHMSCVRSAIRHRDIIIVPNVKVIESLKRSAPEYRKTDWEDDHATNLRYFVDEAVAARKKLDKCRVDNTKETCIKIMARSARDFERYIEAFDLRDAPKRYTILHTVMDMGIEDVDNLVEVVTTVDKKADKLKTSRLKRAKKAQEKKQKKAMEDWVAGKAVNTYNIGYNSEVRLRIIKEDVQTSRGSSVPLKHAQLLYKGLQAGKDIEGKNIGHFVINKVTPEMIKIGCHDIPMSEIRRILSQTCATQG